MKVVKSILKGFSFVLQAEQEAKELKDQMKKEKEEERKARQRVKEQIAKDR